MALEHEALQAQQRGAVVAARIDARGRALDLADGRRLRYDRLVLATGARPRRLKLPGAERALMLRTFEDSAALRERFRRGARIAIIGGGFIGLELAASARALGVGSMPLGVRTRSSSWKSARNLASAALIAGCPIPTCCAARDTDRSRSSASNAARRFMSIRFIDFYHLFYRFD